MNSKLIIAVLAIVIIIIGGGYYLFTNSGMTATSDIDADALEHKDALVVNSTNENIENALFTSTNSDENSVLVTNSGKLSLANCILNKTGDTQSSGDDADFYGINSILLINNGASADISNIELISNSKGSNAIFACGSSQNDNQNPEDGGKPPETMIDSMESNDTTVNVDNVKITTYQDKSRGLDATYGGRITASNVEINTNGGSCAAVATDRGEGFIEVSNSVLNTGVDQKSGAGSPCIYSTGEISVEESTGTAYVSQIACIEGKNSINLSDCEFDCYAQGNRQDNGEYVDLGGIFIYQSMSGDADVGTSTFNASETSLSINSESDYYETAPMFHVTNTACVINLDSCQLNFGSGILLDASSQNQLGNSGSNGGDVEFNIEDMDAEGNITVDEISSLELSLNDCKYSGAINSTGNTSVVIHEDATWTLTGDSYVTSLENHGNIELGSYHLYVNGVEYSP